MEKSEARAALRPNGKVGEFTLIQRVKRGGRVSQSIRKQWRVECSCGTRLTVPEAYLVRPDGPKTHCGCKTVKTLKTTQNREYRIWCMMRQRCYTTSHVAYKHYGGRGITMCDAWLDPETGFETFFKEIGPAPSLQHSIDRIDVNGHYEKYHRVTGELQVRWATSKEQAYNTRDAIARREAKAKRAEEQK